MTETKKIIRLNIVVKQQQQKIINRRIFGVNLNGSS